MGLVKTIFGEADMKGNSRRGKKSEMKLTNRGQEIIGIGDWKINTIPWYLSGGIG